jgi:hypothetical protein
MTVNFFKKPAPVPEPVAAPASKPKSLKGKVATASAPVEQAVHKPQIKAKASPDQVLIDEAVRIDFELKASEAYEKIKRLDEIKKVLQSIAATQPTGEEAILTGTEGEITLSACANKTDISDKDGLIGALGQDVFNVISAPNLTDCKKYLSENELLKFIHVTAGSRRLKTIKKFDSKSV